MAPRSLPRTAPTAAPRTPAPPGPDPPTEGGRRRGRRPPVASRMARISESTVSRLSHYYRVLDEVEAEGGKVISSQLLAEREGITSAQVRKDLSYFGSF